MRRESQKRGRAFQSHGTSRGGGTDPKVSEEQQDLMALHPGPDKKTKGNRRIRNRTYGGVRGRESQGSLLLDIEDAILFEKMEMNLPILQ